MDMRRFAYVSLAHVPMSEADLQALLVSARAFNQRVGACGALLGLGQGFIQWIEGEATGLAEAIARIRADTRHHIVATLFDEPADRLLFTQWDMAYPGRRDLATPDELTQWLGELVNPGIALAPSEQQRLTLFSRFWQDWRGRKQGG